MIQNKCVTDRFLCQYFSKMLLHEIID